VCAHTATVPRVAEDRGDHHPPYEGRTSPAERALERSLVDPGGVGKPLRRSSLQRSRSVESYLRGEALPRYIRRAVEIERATRTHLRELERARRRLREECGPDARAFAQLWEARVRSWDFTAVNELVREHNEWYPVERDLPMDPRAGDYVPVNGRSYRRAELDAAWALRRLPARPAAAPPGRGDA
jgi:hypothetical protein